MLMIRGAEMGEVIFDGGFADAAETVGLRWFGHELDNISFTISSFSSAASLARS